MFRGFSTRDEARARLRLIELEISTILRAFPELRRRRGGARFTRPGTDSTQRHGRVTYPARTERSRIVR